MSDKLKNVWKQLKNVATFPINEPVASAVHKINKEVKTRANKAPWYKEPTYQDLTLAYKDAAKINKSKKKK